MVTTGDLKQNYDVLGIVGATVDDQNSVEGKGGCGGSTTTSVTVDANLTYQKELIVFWILQRRKAVMQLYMQHLTIELQLRVQETWRSK